MAAILNKLRIKDDEHGRPTDRWTNPDILPVLPENRTFTKKSYFGFWVAAAISATYWTIGSASIAAGLSAGQAIGAIIVGAAVSGLVCWGCGEFGIQYGLGFPMMSRAAFGMYGSYFVVILKCFSNFVYSGIQSYWGGIAIRVMLSAIFPSFHNMRNTLPESANITTKDFIGTIIYFVFFVALLFVKPYKLQSFFLVSFVGVTLTMLGMFIWALAANKGAGNLVAPPVAISAAETTFQFFQAICSLAATYTGVAIRHSDWSRYTKTPAAARLGACVASPLFVAIAAIVGILVTSASKDLYGIIIWNPMSLLAHIQVVDYSATTRAGTFFAGLGWFLSQLAVNVSSNAVATGMDLASILPQWINARRGSLILAVIAISSTPWNLVNSPGTFITVIGSLGLFISPLIGIYLADYFTVRRKIYKVPDLYIGDKSSIYWFQWGFHWRGFLTWLSLIWMSLPGFAAKIGGFEIHVAWIRIFRVSYLIGLCGGFIIYNLICWLSPVPGVGIMEPYEFHRETDGGSEKDSVIREEKEVSRSSSNV
ncbi:permease for cytosine/purines, uracil, thiamine, allantoin-domain-containing protein [Apodospora peruviana]|uniref:Permease for cytosine/purines, uracil, thiamine, allantoin-domain-containing protein n=1 Tax=Apodospora peruviana TaxID=516989 RepID=A0AAE0HWZ8_9PEZI|nr:permease for cytosine/purines, uracil, thiamine, allantoin-domain-containing protein [Apodospora peruviana]